MVEREGVERGSSAAVALRPAACGGCPAEVALRFCFTEWYGMVRVLNGNGTEW